MCVSETSIGSGFAKSSRLASWFIFSIHYRPLCPTEGTKLQNAPAKNRHPFHPNISATIAPQHIAPIHIRAIAELFAV